MVDLATHLSSLGKNPQFDPSFNLIMEVAPDATFCILANESEFKDLLKGWATRRRGAKWAFWAPFGVAYTHMQFALGMLDKRDVSMRLFETEENALAWLAEAD